MQDREKHNGVTETDAGFAGVRLCGAVTVWAAAVHIVWCGPEIRRVPWEISGHGIPRAAAVRDGRPGESRGAGRASGRPCGGVGGLVPVRAADPLPANRCLRMLSASSCSRVPWPGPVGAYPSGMTAAAPLSGERVLRAAAIPGAGPDRDGVGRRRPRETWDARGMHGGVGEGQGAGLFRKGTGPLLPVVRGGPAGRLRRGRTGPVVATRGRWRAAVDGTGSNLAGQVSASDQEVSRCPS